MKDMTEFVTLYTAIDITKLFDNDEKVDTFLFFLIKHCIENEVHGVSPMVEKESSFCVDFSYLIQIIEEYMVEICKADRALTRRYLKREFFVYNNMFFLIFGIFSFNYQLMSMFVSDFVYIQKSKDNTRKEVKKSWMPAFYVDKNGTEYYFRQVQFSKVMIENRIDNAEKNGKNSPLNFALYAKLLNKTGEKKLEQTAWGKEASKRYRELGNDVEYFWKYNELYSVSRARV